MNIRNGEPVAVKTIKLTESKGKIELAEKEIKHL